MTRKKVERNEDPEVATEPSRHPAVILLVSSNDRERVAAEDHLRRRYREDYDIHAEGSTPPRSSD